jgi:hypothetical protein
LLTTTISELIDASESHLKFTVHYKLGFGYLAVNILLVKSIAKFMFKQLELVLSVRLFILNVPPPQNDPTGFPNGN